MKSLKCIILVKFNPNHTTCFNLIPCNVNTLKTCNINIIFDIIHVQIKYWLHFMWLLLMWTCAQLLIDVDS